MTTDNDHASEGIDQSGFTNEPQTVLTRRSPIRWTVGVIVRVCIWCALLAVFLRCPSRVSDLNGSSPSVCKPYLIARSHVEPHIVPYYHTYGAPYVDRARPYVLVLNEQVYSPVAKVTKQGYDKYGAPAWDQAQTYTQKQWDAHVVPRLQSAQAHVNRMYKAEVEPYVQRGMASMSPYYEKANAVFWKAYGEYVLPIYAYSGPFIGKSYTSGQDMLTTTVLPYAHGTWSSVIYFAHSEVWPRITGLYSENVEPQLHKIGQRLASYREGKRLRGTAEDFTSSSEPTVSATGYESPETTVGSTISTTTPLSETSSTSTAPEKTLSPAEQVAQERERIASDLQRWQGKFAVAADKGVEDLDERLQEIVENHVVSGVKGHGESLATTLENVVESELLTVKHRISTLAESLPFSDAPDDEEIAQDQLLDDIRRAAILIRERAQTLRDWYNSFDEELVHRVSAAVNSTLDILDNVRDLGLQEIGMRWAWMDGVTYKDWEKYHALKARFEDWRHEISDVGMQHKKVEEARSLASEVMDHGMDVAQASAKELARLKDVGRWKIAAREVSDNFDTRADPPPSWPKPSDESASADGDVPDGEALSPQSSVDTADTVSAAQTPVPIEETAEVDIEADDEIPPADQHVLKTSDGDLPGHESRSVASIPTRSTETVFDGSTNEDQINKDIHDSRNAWGVAAADVMREQVPISQDSPNYESEDVDQGQFPEDQKNLMGEGGDRYVGVKEAASEALLTRSSGQSSDQYSRAPSATSHVLYDTVEPAQPWTTKPLDHITSMASSRLNHDLDVASKQFARVQASVAPTSTSGHNPIIIDARRRYYEAIGLAHDHYSAFVSTASQTVYGAATQTPENWIGLVSAVSEQVYGSEDPSSQQSLSSSAAEHEVTHLAASDAPSASAQAKDTVPDTEAEYVEEAGGVV